MKGGLGKGLSALIRPSGQTQSPQGHEGHDEAPSTPVREEHEPPQQGSIAHIEISRIRPNPYQPRADFDPVALDELKDSIRQKGVIQPITVRIAADSRFELISGERRLRACMELGLPTIPAYIIDVRTNEEMLELALVENLQREHLNPIEIAISYQRLMNDVNLTVEDVAQKVSKDRTTVTNFLRLLKLPDQVQQSLRKGELTTGHARALLGAPDEQVQLKLFDKILKNDLNVRQVEKFVREAQKKLEGGVTSRSHRAGSTPVGNLEERLQQLLGTKVRISMQEGGRGEIAIEFYSSDDLERVYELLNTIRL